MRADSRTRSALLRHCFSWKISCHGVKNLFYFILQSPGLTLYTFSSFHESARRSSTILAGTVWTTYFGNKEGKGVQFCQAGTRIAISMQLERGVTSLYLVLGMISMAVSEAEW